MRRGGGGRGGGGKGGRGGGGAGSGRRDARPGSASYRDDRGRRPDYRSRRTPSPDRCPRRPRGEDHERDRTRGGRIGYGDRSTPRGGRIGYGDRSPPRGGRIGYGDRSPPRSGRIGYGDCSPPRGGRTGHGDRSPPRRERAGYADRDASPRRGHAQNKDAYDPPGRDRHDSPRGRGEYADSRVSPRGARDYERAPYREERDRYDRPGRLADLGHDSPPAYMLPDHPSDLGRPASLRAGKKESDYFGGGSGDDRSLLKDDYLGGGLGPRSMGKENELFANGGVTLRISATEMGRTSAMYSQDRRLSPPPPLYPYVPHETGLLTGGSAMKTSDGYGAGSTQQLHDDGNFKYHKNVPHIERSRDTERHYSGTRDVVVGGVTERYYSADDVPAGRIRETEKLYSSALPAKNHHPYRMHTEPGYETSNGYIMDGLGRSSHDSLGHGSDHPHRLSGGSLEHGSGHGDETLLDIARQAHSKHTPRAASLEYDVHDPYTVPENLCGNVSQSSRHISVSTSLRGLRDERINDNLRLSRRIEEDKGSIEAMHQDTEHLIQHSYDGDASVQYPITRGGDDRYSHSPGTEPIGIVRRPVRRHEFDSFGYSSDQEAPLMVSRKRCRSPEYHDHEIDVYQADHGFAGHERYDDDIDEYDLPPPRMSRYDMFDDDEYGEGYDMPSNSNVFSRLGLPHETNGEWTDIDQGNQPHSDILDYGWSKHVPLYKRLSGPFGGTPMRGRGRGGSTKSAKKRLRTAPHQFHGGYPSDRNEFVRPDKFSKSSKDEPNGSEVKHEDAPEHEDLPLQKDPPEGSDEFSKQVDEAFLKYTKILNESPAMQKKYREASKGSLSCCVCGSVPRKFPDLDALLSHAYDTCKAGLKTKHLGFHKALCVLMGWNWHVAPDTSKAHYSIPSEEVNAMRGDLMLWPPVVVIHNSLTGNQAKDTDAKIVSIEVIEAVLADIGVAREKARVSHGRPANQFLVKFQPTISGFQEAMRVHTHFSTRNHGKEELQLMRVSKGKKAASTAGSLEELLYAHIGVAEDLGLLDEATKKRCKVRSKKEIEANADATLNLEP